MDFVSFSHAFVDVSMFVFSAPPNSRRESLEAEKKDVPSTVERALNLGPFLKFVNREESINFLLKHTADQYVLYLEGFKEKQAMFAACSGGPGLGKVGLLVFRWGNFFILLCRQLLPAKHFPVPWMQVAKIRKSCGRTFVIGKVSSKL